MKGIDQPNLDTAITLGDAVCKELGICCGARGRVIFAIYQRLREMESKKDITAEPEVTETQKAGSVSSSSGGEA